MSKKNKNLVGVQFEINSINCFEPVFINLFKVRNFQNLSRILFLNLFNSDSLTVIWVEVFSFKIWFGFINRIMLNLGVWSLFKPELTTEEK